jgi:HK97 family phage prohead protease
MTTTFSTKAIPGQLSVDEAEGIVECFVAGIGNKDSVGDIVLPGAFEGSLKRRRPRVVWGHDWNHPIGKVLDIYEVGPNDPRLPSKMKVAGIGGLFAKVQFNLKSERGREAFANVVFFGGDQEWSIGYKTLKADYDNARQANLLREVELYEVSPVLHGANQLTATISIKADNANDRVTSFKKSEWPMFDRQFAEMIKNEHPDIWDAGGNIKGDDQYTILTRIAEQGGVANTEDQIAALELREAWVARHEGDFRLPGVIAQIKWLAIGSRGEGHMKDVVREEISKRNMKKKADGECPPATRDIAVNLKNRQNAIETAGYGPLNPAEPNDAFWQKKADRWDVNADEAKKQRCGNCAAFIKTDSMLDCIKQGLGNETGNDAIDVIDAGDLGYCEAFDFKCASARTCDAWITGGPITKGHGYGNYGGGSSEDDPMEELGRIAMGREMEEDESPRNDAMGRRAVLARALANEMRTPVRIRTITGNTVVFDVMGEDEEEVTMRASWHAERGQVMIGRPERVRVETVYLPLQGDPEGEAYMGDEQFKAPTPLDAIPQEQITGDVLRGRGPRRGNLERLLRYWRPIMRKPGGFRRCLVILADHPELYPLQNICAWLHHETTGLWPNEGCHHPGMKNCRRKIRGVVRGSVISDSEFDNRLRQLGGNEKGMPDPFEDDYEKDDMGDVTDEDIDFANKVLNWFVGEEKDFMEYISNEDNWTHEGEDEEGNWSEHEWVTPDNAPSEISAKKPGSCGCGCGGKDDGESLDMPKSVEASLVALQQKVGRTINSRNAQKISQAIDLLTEVIGGGAPASIERKGKSAFISADMKNLFDLRESIDPVLDYYGIDAEIDENGIALKGLEGDDAFSAIKSVVSNFDEIQIKGMGRRIGQMATPNGGGGGWRPRDGRGVNTGGSGWRPHDGDGDGRVSIRPGAPDTTPAPKVNIPELEARIAKLNWDSGPKGPSRDEADPKKWGKYALEDLDDMDDDALEKLRDSAPQEPYGGNPLVGDEAWGAAVGRQAHRLLKERQSRQKLRDQSGRRPRRR